MVKSLKCMFIVQPKPLITAHPFVCQHRFRDKNCSDLNNSKFLICITSCWHNTSDVGQTNNSRLMRAWERSLPIKNLSTWSNCSLSAISKVSTCKQISFFQRGISSFHDIFIVEETFFFWSAPQSQKGRWWRFSFEFPKALLWILDRDKPACLVTTKTKNDQDK